MELDSALPIDRQSIWKLAGKNSNLIFALMESLWTQPAALGTIPAVFGKLRQALLMFPPHPASSESPGIFAS